MFFFYLPHTVTEKQWGVPIHTNEICRKAFCSVALFFSIREVRSCNTYTLVPNKKKYTKRLLSFRTDRLYRYIHGEWEKRFTVQERDREKIKLRERTDQTFLTITIISICSIYKRLYIDNRTYKNGRESIPNKKKNIKHR